MSIYKYDNTFMGGYVNTNDIVYANMGQRQTPFYGKRFGIGGDYGPPSLYTSLSSSHMQRQPPGIFTPDNTIVKNYISPTVSHPSSKITFPGSDISARTIFSNVEREFGGKYKTIYVNLQ